jgi:hypothetical protein
MWWVWKAMRNSVHDTWYYAGRVATKLAHHTLASPQSYCAVKGVFCTYVQCRTPNLDSIT